jgi:uncharacterized protein (DUF1778 family)
MRKAPQHTTIEIRADARGHHLIDRAAQLAGKTNAQLIVEASTMAVQRVVLDQLASS